LHFFLKIFAYIIKKYYLCSGNERGGRIGFLVLLEKGNILYPNKNMIDKQQLQTLVEEKLQNTDYELIVLKVSGQNEILVEVDKLDGVDVEFCAELNHYLVEQLDAQGLEDYSLEVGSVSLTAPFVTKMQYTKHLGHDVEVLALDGKKYRGTLVSVDENSFAIDTEVMVVVEGKKRKQKEVQTLTFTFDGVKYTKYDLKF
jgi:ribosome maturation factor RimP